MRATAPRRGLAWAEEWRADPNSALVARLALAKESLFADWKLWFTHCGQYLLGQVEKCFMCFVLLSARLFIGH